jgi:uncharacterized membrane protein YfcA
VILGQHTVSDLVWVGLSILLLAMSKGGFPVGPVALPMLILVWPREAGAARSAVAFMLPVLCAMDVFAIVFYRRHILWRMLVPLLPATLAGVALASGLFVSDEAALIAVSDRALKLCIGSVGLSFVVYEATRARILRRLRAWQTEGWLAGNVFGFAAGVTSTLAHAAGPVLQMYLLPRNLAKLHFAGTTAAYFFVLNLVKMAPFSLMGRIQTGNLMLAACLFPLVPLGVWAGYRLVHLTQPRYYTVLIHAVLAFTSTALVIQGLR